MSGLRVDVAVVGAGLMGAATPGELTRRGVSVALPEALDPGHVHGSSHGTSRIVRRAYADPFHVRLTGRAFEAWQRAEDDTGETLLRTTGGLDTGAHRDSAGLAALTTPTEDFVLDRVGPVVVVSPCSGHGATFAALVGELAADLAMGAVGAEPRFALGRVGTMA